MAKVVIKSLNVLGLSHEFGGQVLRMKPGSSVSLRELSVQQKPLKFEKCVLLIHLAIHFLGTHV
jgi:hypothetical protein